MKKKIASLCFLRGCQMAEVRARPQIILAHENNHSYKRKSLTDNCITGKSCKSVVNLITAIKKGRLDFFLLCYILI